jgi:hypothetical protein
LAISSRQQFPVFEFETLDLLSSIEQFAECRALLNIAKAIAAATRSSVSTRLSFQTTSRFAETGERAVECRREWLCDKGISDNRSRPPITAAPESFWPRMYMK